MLPYDLPDIAPALVYLDYLGIAVFATSGALLAAQKRLDLVTFIFFAVVTGMGGGTIRDLLIGAPVFWVHENWLLLICMAAALLVWITPLKIWTGATLVWLDAVGIAAYATFGASKGISFGAAPLPAFGLGVLTACAGGIIRDLLAGDPSILLRTELYITAAALSAGLTILLMLAGVPPVPAGLLAAVAGFALRGFAIVRGWGLPAYRR